MGCIPVIMNNNDSWIIMSNDKYNNSWIVIFMNHWIKTNRPSNLLSLILFNNLLLPCFMFSYYHYYLINYIYFALSCLESMKVKVTQCPTLCSPMDCTVHGILQARILEWVVFPFSRGSSQPTDRTQVSRIAGRFLISWATREALSCLITYHFILECEDMKFVCFIHHRIPLM